MSMLKSTLIGAGLSIAATTGVLAQSMTPEVNDGIAMVVSTNGSLGYLGGSPTKVNPTGHRMLMQHAKRLPSGTII